MSRGDMNQRVVAIIQARMGSTRLPGKVLMDIGGATMLARVVTRARRATLLSDVVVATTSDQADQAICEECEYLNVPSFRGECEDVLDRYYQATRAYRAQTIVRISADCPLIDPEVIDRVLRAFVRERPDYASNTLERTYPRGLDAEVMTKDALARAWREAGEPYQRAHVTPYIYEHPGSFVLLSVTGEENYSQYRWTVDTREDLDFVRAIFACLENTDMFAWRDVLGLIMRESGLVELNRHVLQKDLKQG